MPEKPNERKKKAKPPAPRATTQSRAPARAKPDATRVDAVRRDAVVYITVPELSVIVSEQKAGGTTPRGPFGAFDEARSAAVDALLEAIERAELRLLAVKRATNVDELRVAGASPAPS